MISSAKQALLASTLANRGGLVVEDVFSTDLWAGNSSTQTITNGLDLSTEGGLVWIKSRSTTFPNNLYDTERGATTRLESDSTGAEVTMPTSLTSFNSDGFSLGSFSNVNNTGNTYVGWTFRKAPNFFDVVTYTGTGSARTVAHNLGSVPGMIIVKRTNDAANWVVYHRANTAEPETERLYLNQTAATEDATTWNDTAPTDTEFTVGTFAENNGSGDEYVAYLFAHDTSDEGFIQCGTFTTSSGGSDVSLGWEPQLVLVKSASSATNWYLFDTARGMIVGNDDYLKPNSSSAEANDSIPYINPMADGFHENFDDALGTGVTCIYMAIRRGPMRQPTAGTDVYTSDIWTGNSTARLIDGFGFPPDIAIIRDRSATTGYSYCIQDKLRGVSNELQTWNTGAEQTNITQTVTSFDMDGIALGTDTPNHGYNKTPNPEVGHFFRRSPGVFDVVAFTGTNVTDQRISHNLGAIPELIITKNRDSAMIWYTYSNTGLLTQYLYLNGTQAFVTNGVALWGATPTSTDFGYNSTVSGSGSTTDDQIAYLFATLAGISKVGSYTGDGTTGKVIDCGFTTGARFILIKRTDSTGDWYVWDSVRGIVAGNDPHLSLNTTAAEVTTDDSVDPDSSGFIVNQNATTNINVTSATYIFLAFA
jgi:hypothetical protein